MGDSEERKLQEILSYPRTYDNVFVKFKTLENENVSKTWKMVVDWDQVACSC